MWRMLLAVSRHIIKTIRGCKYVYDHKTYRRAGRIRSIAKFVGPLEEVHYQWRRTWS
jgi:hypothetical protein